MTRVLVSDREYKNCIERSLREEYVSVNERNTRNELKINSVFPILQITEDHPLKDDFSEKEPFLIHPPKPKRMKLSSTVKKDRLDDEFYLDDLLRAFAYLITCRRIDLPR